MHGDLNSAETKLLNNKKIHQTNGKRTNGSRRKSKQKPMRNCDVGLHQAESYPQWRLNESSELHENTSSFEKLEVGHWIVDECQSGPIDDAVCETAVPKDFLLESTASRRRGRACHKDKSAQMQKKGAAKNLSELNEDWCTQGCFAQSDLSKEGMQLIKQYKKELLVGNWSSSQPQESSRHVPCIDSVQPPDALLKDSLVIKETMKKNKGRKRIRGSKRTLNSNAVMSPGNCQHGEEINGETSLGNEIPTIEKLTQQQTKLQSEFLGDDRKEQLNYPRFETRLTKNQINSTECCDSGSRHNNYRSRKSLDCKKYSSKKSENNNMQGNHRFSESHEEMFLTCDEVEKSPQEETLKSRSSNRVALDEKMDDEKGTEEYEERVVKDNSDWRKGENNVTRQLTKAQGNEENVGANNLKYGEKRGNSAEKDRVEDLVIPSGLFKDFTVVFNNQGFYILDDRIEVVIDGTQGKDYIHLILFYCDPQDHKRKVRDGYRICAESILMNTVSTDDIRNALEELAQHLQHVWQGSFLPEKPPYDVSLYSLPYLARRSVHPLKKKSDRFVRAIYFCNLCYMHINSIDSARRHFEGYEHLCAEKRKAAINDLRSLPQPGVTYLTKLNSVLEEVVKSECLEDSVYVKVDEFTAFLTKILKSKVHEDCSLRLYGSFLTRVASASSNINYSLLYPPSFSRGQILGFVKRALETECSMLSEFATDYQRSDPSVHFKVEAGYVAKHPITVFISCHALSALKLSYVISVLGRLRSQLIPLICVFRSWAKLCKLHVVALGGIPLYGFDLMLIHYLQHCHLLPHVEIEQENEHEVQSDEPYSSYNKFVSSSDREKMSKRVHDLAETFGDDRNDWNIADLWIRVLRYFAVEHSTEELIGMDYPINVNAAVLDGRWNKKRIAVKDPFVDRLMQPASHFSCYFSNCFMASFLYFAIPRTFKGPLTPYNLVIPRKTLLTKEGEDERIRRKERISAKLRTIAVEDAGQGDENISKDQSGFLEDSLYTEMVEKSDMEDLIRVENLTDLEEENLSESNMTGESMLNDAVLQKSTACSDLLSLDSPEDIDEEASKIYKPLKFYSVCEAEEDINQVIREVVENCVIQAGESTNSKDAVRLRYDRKTLIDLQFYSSSVKLNTQYLEDIGVYHLATSTSIQNCESDDDLKVIKCEFLVELPALKSMSQTNFLNINPEEFILVWNAEFFSNGTKPDIHCNSCGVSGHLMEECPELQLPKLVPLPSLNGAQRMTLKAIVKVLSSTCSIRRSRIEAMDDLRFTLEKLFQERLRSDSRLTLFGSFGNGFGMKDSDADMCLRFGEDSLSEELDPIQIVRKVAEVLHSVPYIYNIETVVRAKVPIVKFRTLFPIELEADLSLYNELAIQNTRLLQTYCKIDARAKQLGIMVKEWARWCMIGDASRGSLSSYSYVIMVIYYLQRITPPVLPFLQEVSVGEEKPVKIIDGHDVFFHCFSDVNWKSSNMQSAGELWLGFLVFFAEKFDFETEVIQIRRREPLNKLDKGWQSRPIAIEDPFDLNHNLSSGVHKKTMIYIQKSFVQSRERFGMLRPLPNVLLDFFKRATNINHSIPEVREIERLAYIIIRSCRVGKGPPLGANCCYKCRQIGHFVNNCPQSSKGTTRELGRRSTKTQWLR